MPEEDVMSTRPMLIRTIGVVVMFSILGAIAVRADGRQATTDKDTQIFDEFKKRVHDYVALHQKIESSIGKLPDKATPQQIDTFQRELGKGVVAARATAKQGDIFGPDTTALIRRMFTTVFSGPNGARLRKEIT